MDKKTEYNLFDPPLPDGDEPQVWCGLHGNSKGLVIAQCARKSHSPVILVTPDSLSTERYVEELNFFLPDALDCRVLNFPEWETLPYDRFSPYQDIVSDRLAVLAQLPDLERGIVLVSVQSIMHRLAPSDYILANSLTFEVGQALDLGKFRERLERGGYRCVSQVYEHGDYAVRGSLLDLYPMGSEHPYRIDLFDDVIDTIRIFDCESQLSTDRVTRMRLLPAREFALTESAITRFRKAWRSRFEGKAIDCPMYRDVSEGLVPAGIEYYLPLFFERTSLFAEYLACTPTIIVEDGVFEAAEKYWDDINARYESGRYDRERPLLPPESVFVSPQMLMQTIEACPRVFFDRFGESKASQAFAFKTQIPVQIPINARADQPLAVLRRYLERFPGRILFVAESAGRRETLLELLRAHELGIQVVESWGHFLASDYRIAITVAPLSRGGQTDDPAIVIITESQLFGERVAQRRRRRTNRDTETLVRNLTELQIGSAVVHEEHGVGRYRGLTTLEIGDIKGEFLIIEYADGDKLYVPVSSLHLISRYSGVDLEHAPLHKLGSNQWQRARVKAARRIHDVAAELLEIHARRAARSGYSYPLDNDAYLAFKQAFPFEETPDQEAAIEAVLQDMRSDKPMDRLVCGDVGFGKTEVAMRAAFVAVHAGRQVAMLVPTTLLAQQHFNNFCDRFADWPVKIEYLSRFKGKKAQDATMQGLQSGAIDIVIGTHKLLQQDIAFKRLGLLIVDEEHRFGVRQKERLKALRAEVDILTLTATPIPRSLNMSLAGVRELSIIATPPSRRLAIKTFIREWDDDVLREAFLREVNRGGQVYFLFNRVDEIEKQAQRIQKLVPEARVRIAHGQMRERDLDTVMTDFYHRRFNVLVCTTIIESGIDIPTANTIIVDRADKLGLTQLYQLRGRVGRSHHRAYAYLLIPPKKAMTADALRRLEAIGSLEELGVGFTIATHDLEIRGAGEILGDEQSGHIQEIGFGLYTELLARAVAAMKAGLQPPEEISGQVTEVDLHICSLLPEDYIPDVHTRLIMYKRTASVKDDHELAEVKAETIDRFGMLPPPAQNLFRIAALKLKATDIGIKKIDIGSRYGSVQFFEKPNLDPSSIINLIQTHPQTYRLDGQDKLKIVKEMPDEESRFDVVNGLLDKLLVRDAA